MEKGKGRALEFLSSYKKDVVLISLLVLISLAIILVFSLTRVGGEYVVVTEGGVEVARYSLRVDAEYSLAEGGNILVIEDGYAYMREATCPDLTCVKVGRISYVGETITCLPHLITVTVVGEGDCDLVS